MTSPRKAEWAALYDDGSEKFTVSYDATNPEDRRVVRIEQGSESWVWIDPEDAAFLAARILDAAAALKSEN